MRGGSDLLARFCRYHDLVLPPSVLDSSPRMSFIKDEVIRNLKGAQNSFAPVWDVSLSLRAARRRLEANPNGILEFLESCWLADQKAKVLRDFGVPIPVLRPDLASSQLRELEPDFLVLKTLRE